MPENDLLSRWGAGGVFSTCIFCKSQQRSAFWIYIKIPIGNCEGKSFYFYDYFIIQLGVSEQTVLHVNMTSITLDCPPIVATGPGKDLVAFRNEIEQHMQLTHSCCHQFLLEGNSRYTGAKVRAKCFYYNNHKTCNCFKETYDVGLIESVDGFWMKQSLWTIVSPYI
jgi:hypothetical protein